MRSGFLSLVTLVLVAVRVSDARPLTPHWGFESPRPADSAEPERKHSRTPSAQRHVSFRPPQLRPPVVQLPSSRFPAEPQDPVTDTAVRYEVREPPRVAVRCGDDRVQVEMKQDLLGLGRVDPDEVTLGGCPATEVDDWAHVLVFESELHGCGSTFVMTAHTFIYVFALVYEPRALGNTGIIRSQRAEVKVECHYPRYMQPRL